MLSPHNSTQNPVLVLCFQNPNVLLARDYRLRWGRRSWLGLVISYLAETDLKSSGSSMASLHLSSVCVWLLEELWLFWLKKQSRFNINLWLRMQNLNFHYNMSIYGKRQSTDDLASRCITLACVYHTCSELLLFDNVGSEDFLPMTGLYENQDLNANKVSKTMIAS